VDIIFAGICCWVDARSPKTGKTVIIRNALLGGMHDTSTIPAHLAFIQAKLAAVDSSNWPTSSLSYADNAYYFLTGDQLTFDPVPSGGGVDLSLLPHVKINTGAGAICSAADEIRDGFLDNPSTPNVLALVDVPADADVRGMANDNGNAHPAIFALLTLNAPRLTITATPFPDGAGVPRSLTITDPNAQVIIGNVEFGAYLVGAGASDDQHKYLYCDIFKPSTAGAKTVASGVKAQPIAPAKNGVTKSQAPHVATLIDRSHQGIFDEIRLGELHRAANRPTTAFLDTLAAGCSDTQWP
jgi:hypothetical protein